MRRYILFTLTTAAVCFCQDAQRARPDLPPITVTVPAENPWTTLVKVATPALLTLFGVWLTNKKNAAENAANREHQLSIERIKDEIAAEAKSRDNQWEFRKEVYVNLLNSITDCISVLSQFHELELLSPTKMASPEAELQKRLADHRGIFMSASGTSIRFANLAPLAVADSVIPILMTLDKQLPAFFASNVERAASLKAIANFNAARDALQDAGRKDLWETSRTS